MDSMLQTMYVENASGKSMWKKGRKIHTKKYKNNFVKERKKERKNLPPKSNSKLSSESKSSKHIEELSSQQTISFN